MNYHRAICKHCTATKCHDCPTPQEPIEIECVACDGHGCEHCTNGYQVIDSCPRKLIDGDAYECLLLAEMYEKGLPPVAGGTLDQSQWFLSLYRYAQNQKSVIESNEVKSRV